MPQQILYIGRIRDKWMFTQGLGGPLRSVPIADIAGFDDVSACLHAMFPLGFVVATALHDPDPRQERNA